MGSLFNIVLYSTDSLKAADAASHTFRLIDTLNGIYSDYLPGSELNRLCARSGGSERVPVSKSLCSILQRAYEASILSNGSFDVTAGPLVRLWRFARQHKMLPPRDSLRRARSRVGFRYMVIDTVKQTVWLRKAGMQLDLGGIAKGETAQRAIDRLSELGFPYALIDAGGDIVAGGVPGAVNGWQVAINLPGSEDLMEGRLILKNKAVTTSGDLYQYVEINNKRYSHIIDPRSGKALTNSRNVTVIADKGIDADWLTKACSILPLRKALRLIKRFKNAEVQISVLKNGKPRFYRSAGFTSYFNNPAP